MKLIFEQKVFYLDNANVEFKLEYHDNEKIYYKAEIIDKDLVKNIDITKRAIDKIFYELKQQVYLKMSIKE